LNFSASFAFLGAITRPEKNKGKGFCISLNQHFLKYPSVASSQVVQRIEHVH